MNPSDEDAAKLDQILAAMVETRTSARIILAATAILFFLLVGLTAASIVQSFALEAS